MPDPYPQNSVSLIPRILQGERDLYLQIVRQYELMLRSYLASQLYNLSDVDDLAQETFLAAFKDLAAYRTDSDFGTWLRGIARHRLLHHFRTLQRRDSALNRFREEVSRIAAEPLDHAFQRDVGEPHTRLLHCITRLPEKLRRIVHAGLEGLKPASLAEELHTSVAAIYQLHYRANRHLRECLKKEFPA